MHGKIWVPCCYKHQGAAWRAASSWVSWEKTTRKKLFPKSFTCKTGQWFLSNCAIAQIFLTDLIGGGLSVTYKILAVSLSILRSNLTFSWSISLQWTLLSFHVQWSRVLPDPAWFWSQKRGVINSSCRTSVGRSLHSDAKPDPFPLASLIVVDAILLPLYFVDANRLNQMLIQTTIANGAPYLLWGLVANQVCHFDPCITEYDMRKWFQFVHWFLTDVDQPIVCFPRSNPEDFDAGLDLWIPLSYWPQVAGRRFGLKAV